MNTNSKQSTDKVHSAAIYGFVWVVLGLFAFVLLPAPEVDASLDLISPSDCEETDPCGPTDKVTVFRWTRSNSPLTQSYRVVFGESRDFDTITENFRVLPGPNDEKIIAPQVALNLANEFDDFKTYYWRVFALDESGIEVEVSTETFAFYYVQDASGFTVITGLVKSDLNQLGLVGAQVAVSSASHAGTENSVVKTEFNGVYIVIALTTDSSGAPINSLLEITVTKKGYQPIVEDGENLPEKDGDGVITVPDLVMESITNETDPSTSNNSAIPAILPFLIED
jgi:hypothetical protein